MADVEKTVQIIFEGDDRVGKTITGLSSSLDTIGSKAASATQPFADLAANALKLEAALAALVAGGFVLAITKAGEFESAFAEISTLIDASDQNINQFKTDILDYARVSTASIEDINGAVYTAISAGTDYADSLDLLNKSERLATAAKADLESTTRLLASTMNSYGASTDQAGRFSDAFFRTVEKGQTTLPELAETLAQVAPLAANLDVPIETLTASIAALTAAGVPTSQAITQIRGALTAFAKPTTQATELAAKLGVDFSTAAIKSKGFEVVLNEIFEAANGDVSILSKMFGRVEALNAVLVLGGDENGKYAESLEALRNSAGATDIAFEKMAQNLDLVFQTLKNNLQAVLIDLGAPLLDESVDLIESVSEVFRQVSFSFNDGAFDPIFDLVESFIAKLATDLSTIAEILPEALEGVDYSGLINSIEGLGDEIKDLFSAFFDDVDLTTPEGLAAAIQKVVDSGESLTRIVAGILDTWEPFIEAISAGIDKFNESDDAVKDLIGQFLGWSQQINLVANNIGILTGALSVIAGSLSLMSATTLVNTIAGFKGFASVIGTTAIGLGQFIAVATAPVAGWYIGTWLRDNIPIVESFGNVLGSAGFKLLNFGDDSVEAAEAQAQQTQALAAQALEMVRVKEALDELPDQKTMEVTLLGVQTVQEDFEAINDELELLPDEKTTAVKAEIDQQSFDKVGGIIIEVGEDGATVLVDARTDKPSFAAVEEEIEKIPEEKELELKLKGEIEKELAQIEAQADIIQTAMEWEARVNIAEVEAAAEIVTALSGDIAEMFSSSGDVIGSLVESLENLDSYDRLQIFEYLEKEAELRAQLVELETDLTQAQVDYLNARTAAIKGGTGLVTIRGENLEPELQLVLNRIIELTQIEANEQGLEFLIGV